MLEIIKQSEDLILEIKALQPGDEAKANNCTRKLIQICNFYIEECQEFSIQLQEIHFADIGIASIDRWQTQQINLLQLAKSIHEELKLQHKKKIHEKSNQLQIEELKLALSELKNDSEKDLTLEKNNYQYLQKKYENLKKKHSQLEQEYKDLLGSKKDWYTYFIIVFPLVFFILFFDKFLYISYYNLLKYNVLVKTGIAFAFISGFLYIPLKDKRLVLLPMLFLLLILILQYI
jgi:hypothetical protein